MASEKQVNYLAQLTELAGFEATEERKAKWARWSNERINLVITITQHAISMNTGTTLPDYVAPLGATLKKLDALNDR